MTNIVFRDDVDTVAVCVPDTVGRLIGKRIAVARYNEIAEHGLPMPDYHLVNGIENVPYKDLEITGESTGFRNGLLIPIPDSCFYLSSEPNTAFILAEPRSIDGVLVEQAPRQILRRQLEQLNKLGIAARVASELEFFLFQNTYEAAYYEGYKQLKPFYHFHADWDVLLAGYVEPTIRGIRNELIDAKIDFEGYQGEGGAGQYEINMPPASAIEIADKHAIFKHIVKTVAHSRQCSASFMAKIDSNIAGSSCHVHISLTDTDGKPFDQMGHTERSFIAGLLSFSPELTLLHAPYENSYRRLRPGTFAPCDVSWGWDNRTVMVRLIRQSDQTRIEFRLPGADVNPYLCFAGILAAGIEGINQKLDLPAPTEGSAYKNVLNHGDSEPKLPLDLTQSLEAFRKSELAKKSFSIPVHKHLFDLGLHELNAGRRIVTDWQMERGFERA